MTIIKASTLAALLSAVPSLLGFQPSESLVILPMRGGRTIGAMRLDLPDIGMLSEHSPRIADVIRRTEPESVILVVYSEVDHARHWATVEALDLDLGVDIPIVDAAYVAAVGYGSLLNIGTAGPLSDIVVDPKLGHVAPNNEPDPLPDTSLFEDEILVAIMSQTAEDLGYDQVPPFIEGLLSTDRLLSGTEIGILASILQRPAFRDIALVTIVGGAELGETAVLAQERWQDGAPYPKDVAQLMWGQGAKPDAKRLTKALEHARLASPAMLSLGVGGSLAVCAWLSWALGQSSHAQTYARQALDVEPDHGLAAIVSTFIDGAHIPAWVFTR